MITHETFKDLWWNDQLIEVQDDMDDGWRHGTNHRTVYEVADEDGNGIGVFYRVTYRVSGDKETHGIRDGSFNLDRVWPEIKTITVTQYTDKRPD